MAQDALEKWFLSIDIEVTSTNSRGSPCPRRGGTMLVDDRDKNGKFEASEFADPLLPTKQYMAAMHLTNSSDNLLGHW